MKRRAFIIIGSVLFCAILAGFPVPGFAVGISPGSVVEESVPPNFELVRKFTITRGNPSEDEQATITVTGPAAQYIEVLTQGNVLDLPKGKRAVDIPFKIKTASLSAETYKADLTATIAPKTPTNGSEGYGSRVLSGATGLIRFTVVNDQTEKYTIDTVYVQESEVQTPIGFSFRLSNQGAVYAKPEKVDFVFLQNEDGKEVYRESIDTTVVKAVAPLSTERIDIITKATSLPPGNYRGEFTFYNNDEVVVVDKSVIFRVFPQGTLSQQGELVSLKTEKGSYEPGESVKITGGFKNSGDVGLIAQLNLEIFAGPKRVETLTSKEVFIPKTEAVDFDLFYEQEEGGTYTIKGSVTYGSKKSNIMETTFQINEFPLVLVIGVAIGLCLLIGLVLWFIKKKKGAKTPPAEQTSEQSTPTL